MVPRLLCCNYDASLKEQFLTLIYVHFVCSRAPIAVSHFFAEAVHKQFLTFQIIVMTTIIDSIYQKVTLN